MTAIFNAVDVSSKNGVLDLGSALGCNLSFYAQLGCHFQFENFSFTVGEYTQKKLSEREVVERFLQDINRKKKYDVVLFWDLLNYLPKNLIEELAVKLSSVLKPNALVHMLNFVGSSIPVLPGGYRIKDQYHLQIECAETRVSPIHRVTTMQLVKMFPDFLMVQSYLNGDGMVPGISEQVLRFGVQSQEKGTVFSSSESSNSGLKIDKRLYSPAVEQFISNVDPAQTLLDLSPKRTFNYDFWKKNYQTVFASDLLPVLSTYLKAQKEDRVTYLENGQFLDFDACRKFDVIIAWDLFNYCSEALLSELGKRIVRHCKDGTHLVVMAYTGKTKPAVPQSFKVDQEGVGLMPVSADKKLRENKARLSFIQILKHFPGFYVEKNYSFRPGMQAGLSEYLFVFKGAERIAREKKIMEQEVMARRKAREQSPKVG